MDMSELVTKDKRFEFVPMDEKLGEVITRPSITFWKDVFRRLYGNKIAMIGFCVIVLIGIMSIVAPSLLPYDYKLNDLTAVNKPPSAEHWFGTDHLGRDLWVRTWVGARVSLVVGILGAIIPYLIGMVIGAVCGYVGGKLDMIVMRIVEILICIPSLIYVILIMLLIGSGPLAIIVAFTMTGWTGATRGIRGVVLQLKEREFVLASKALGAKPWWLITKHLIPNYMGIAVVGMTMSVPSAIFQEAFLSFIGLGVRPPMPSWGQLANNGITNFRVYPWQLLIPAAFISITMLSLNLFGDGLRDALDPRLRT
jgi:oligopeptide transport system permease protein